MAESAVEVFVAAFGTEGGAGEALKDFRSCRAGRCDQPDRRRGDRAQGRRQGRLPGDRRPQRQNLGEAGRDRRRRGWPDLPAQHHRHRHRRRVPAAASGARCATRGSRTRTCVRSATAFLRAPARSSPSPRIASSNSSRTASSGLQQDRPPCRQRGRRSHGDRDGGRRRVVITRLRHSVVAWRVARTVPRRPSGETHPPPRVSTGSADYRRHVARVLTQKASLG